MARRSAKAARKKEAKRQRSVEKRSQRARNRAMSDVTIGPDRRLIILRDALVNGQLPAPRGLVNLGNTCFFNAVMQNLCRVSPFRDYFVGTLPCPGEGPMTTALRAFFLALWDLNNTSVFDPGNLFSQVGKNNPSFKGRAQQDSHELMRVIFDAVIEEEKKRLTNVANHILPPSLDPETSDDSSENDLDPAIPSDNPVMEVTSEAAATDVTSDPESTTMPPPAPPADSDTASLASTAVCNAIPAEPSTDDVSSDDEIPTEKLVTIVERIVGGVLSSTIECKECGTRSSVAEPFLDLQLPLVPRDEAEAKASISETVKEKASKAASCLKLRKDTGSKSEADQETMSETDEPENKTEVASCAPAPPSPPPPQPPPPPPPLPAPPRRPEHVAGGSTTSNCDVMRQLRETVIPSESEPVQENRLIVYTGDTILAHPPTDTEAVFDGDDDDSEDCPFLSSLFEDDLDDPIDSAVDDISSMNAFSTSEAAKKDTGQASSSTASKKTVASPPPTRKTPSFITSLFGGLGGISAAPHGYRSVVGSLEEFTKVEVLEGDNAYGCEECTRREKLRAALQARNKLKTVTKKVPLSPSEVESDNRQSDRVAEVDGSSPINSQDVMRTVPELQNASTLSANERLASEVEVGQGDAQILMSSPVTSSESSSGVSSEDDGELVIEEELEEAPMDTEPIRELTREEEDEIIKRFSVDIPGVRTTAEKRLLIRDAPNVLALQLKRFTQVGYRGGLRKISGHVEYPLSLDMTPFVEETTHKSCILAEKNKPAVAKRKRNNHEASEKRKKYEYVLTGIVVHGGSLTGGHYTACVREGVEPNSRGGWYFCNDSKVSRASEKDVLNSEAYLLYYERINI